jgi:hypothetical protein
MVTHPRVEMEIEHDSFVHVKVWRNVFSEHCMSLGSEALRDEIRREGELE